MPDRPHSRTTRIHPKPRSITEVMRSLRSLADWHALRTYYLSQLDWPASRDEQRSRSFGRSIPWWSYSCTHFLEQVVPVEASVLEFGGGASTVWWLERGNRVTTLESSPQWIESVRESCASHIDRLDLMVADFDKPESVSAAVDGPFDVIVIDNEGPRTPLVAIAIELVSDDGLIILDNADRDDYSQGVLDLEEAGFRRLDFFGLAPISAYASVTALFTKSAQISIGGRTATFSTVEY